MTPLGRIVAFALFDGYTRVWLPTISALTFYLKNWPFMLGWVEIRKPNSYGACK